MKNIKNNKNHFIVTLKILSVETLYYYVLGTIKLFEQFWTFKIFELF